MSVIHSHFLYPLYQNERNGASGQKVRCVYCDEKSRNLEGQTLTIKGYYLPQYKEVTYEMVGKFANNPTYGLEFHVDSYKEIIQKSRVGIISYLSSGILKGIGPKTAERIYDRFGNQTLQILDNDIKRLSEVKGISDKKVREIKRTYTENRSAREVLQFLKPFGVSTAQAIKVYKEFGEESLDVLREDTFRICKIKGFGFENVDKMARATGLNLNSKKRIKAAIIYLLKKNESSGHCGMEKSLLLSHLNKTLGCPSVPQQIVNSASNEMIVNKEVIIGRCKGKNGKIEKEYIYIPNTYYSETMLAKNLVMLSATVCSTSCNEEDLIKAQEKYNIVLHEQQIEAVRGGLQNSFSIITGGPGTGKTSILKILCEIYSMKYPKKTMLFLSPTGKAARRMEESTGYPAQTIHSALKIAIDEDICEETVLNADLIIVDEVSMMDIFIAEKLATSMLPGCQLVFVGDVDQLPSVGPGAVLHDIIEAAVCPVYMLTKIFRQEGDNNLIVINSQKIKKGNTLLEYGNGYYHYETDNPTIATSYSISLYLKKVNEYGMGNVGLLLPMRKGPNGIQVVNQRIQEVLNPHKLGNSEISFCGTVYRVGDVVMQLKNTFKEGVSNGDIGYVTLIGSDENGKYLIVTYFADTINSLEVKYQGDKLSELELAYAITVHKSQGSEYDCVITSFLTSHGRMLKRNIIYTAITRAKYEINHVGSVKAVKTAIERHSEIRNTLLVEKSQYYQEIEGVKALAKRCPFKSATH